ncbi:tannase and feruloyl esterase [Mycena belliarum]|uniref:Carboxylic ester hydrolase n=1 Tax=Mycena belliarum TaxID=1033014 RepID=A0AAD6TL98_9AGAR|nr:tannase and feruloyl esterase [Mycena belliae]
MDRSGFNVNFLSNLLTVGLFASWNPSEQHAKCLALKSSLALQNTTILDVSYLKADSTLKLQGACVPKAHVGASLCRVQFVTDTSETSSVRAEAWLPDEWYGRFLGVGNGGLGGCIAYRDLEYGSALHFATVASNNGHDGGTGIHFLNNPEVLNDFAYRSIHVEAVIGKQIVAKYYGQPPSKSYYVGCSTGGRQGTQTALKYPEDFDGILAGAPATDFNHLLHWTGMLARHVGGLNGPPIISPEMWKAIAQEVLNQCDGLDGVRDGIITEPDACDFRPEALMCTAEENGKCLTRPQVEALRKIYSPIYSAGELIYPRFDPGADGAFIGGPTLQFTKDWLQYAEMADAVNPGGIATFDGDLSAFRDRGGKFLTYHGRVDPAIASGNAKRVYNLVARTLGPASLDAFYRLFLVPGMDHCVGGPGAASFGQLGGTNAVNASTHNILLALVDWVEGGVAPDTVTGTAPDGATRVHCRYPQRSVWDGAAYACEA